MKGIQVILYICLISVLIGCGNGSYIKLENTIKADWAIGDSISLYNGNKPYYYAIGGKMMNYNPDTKKIRTIAETGASKISSFVLTDEYAYYCNVFDEGGQIGEIRAVELGTGNDVLIAKDYSTKMVANDGSLFYYDENSGCIKKFEISKNELSVIFKVSSQVSENDMETEVETLRIRGEKLLFSMGGIYEMDMDGGKVKKIYNIDAYYQLTAFLIKDGDLYYSDLNNTIGGEICRLNLNTLQSKVFISNKNSFLKFYLCDGGLFYIDSDSLFLTDVKNSVEIKIMDGCPETIEFFSDNKMFYVEDALLKSIDLTSGKIKIY